MIWPFPFEGLQAIKYTLPAVTAGDYSKTARFELGKGQKDVRKFGKQKSGGER